MLNYASLTRGVNAFKAFAGVPSLHAIARSGRQFGTHAMGYASASMGGMSSTAYAARGKATQFGRRGMSQARSYFSGADMKGMSRRGQYGVGAGRAAVAGGGAMAAADFLNPFGLGWGD